MDGILSLFETVTLPNNHAFIFKDYLKICADHKVFVNKTAKDVKPIVSYINGKLNSATNRLEGLYMLQTFLPQCSKEVFQENVLMWLHQCMKSGDGKSTQLTVLSYQLIKTLLQITEQMPEMKRSINSLIVIKLVENLQHNIPSQSLLAMLECTETLMSNYGPACGQHKNVLEKILLQHIDSSDRNVVVRLARCMARLPQLSGAGPMGANHTGRWIQEQKRLCATLHGILDELFVFIEEDPNTFKVEISTVKLPLPEISNDSSLIKVFRLVNRFINVAEILRGLLVLKFPADKLVSPEAILQLVCRGLAVTDKSVSSSIATELLVTRALLPRIHVALLKILKSLIICAGRNLIPYGTVVCKQVYQILSWTSTSKWTYSIEKPYGELRAAACNTLVLWLQTSQSGSCVERIADKLVHNLIPDINPGKAAVMLIEDATPKKGSSKQLKKSAMVERNNQTASESLGSEIHIADPKANSKVCRAALKVMQWILLTSSTFINTIIHEKLQNITVKLLNEIQKTGKRHILPVPYSESHCRDELYKLLLMTTMNPHPLRPVPTNQTILIFAGGCLDTDSKVAATCKIGLGSLEKLISGTRPTQHFPTTIEEMLDSMNAQQEVLEQHMEDEIEQVEEEEEEENEEMVEEEEEEEEEEDEDIEDELELPEIQIAEAVSLKSGKTAPEQMEIEEEEPVRKTENKKVQQPVVQQPIVQQPVEKPVANKKDEEDEVEVLSEDEADWNMKNDRKGKLTAEDDEMIDDDEEEDYASEEEDEDGLEDMVDEEDLEDDYEDEDEETEIESEGEAIEHKIIAHNKAVKSVPTEVEKKDEVTISESKSDTQKSEVTQQLTKNVNEVALDNTEHTRSQDKVSLPSVNGNEEKSKELDSSIEEVQSENVEPDSEILERSVEEISEQNKEVVSTTTEETEDNSAQEEHVSEKIDNSSQNGVEKERVVIEELEYTDVEDEIVASVVETKSQRMEYQENNQDAVEEIDDQDAVEEIDDQVVVQEIDDQNVAQEIDDNDVNDEASDGGMHEEHDEQMEEQHAFEGKDDVSVRHQIENQNELPDASDKAVEEKDELVTEEPVHEAEVLKNVCETEENELIKNDETVQSELVHHEDDTVLMPEISDEVEKQDTQEEDGGDTKDITCEKEVVPEQHSDIPKPEDHVLSDEICTDKDNTVVDIGESEAKVTAVSEVKAVEGEDMQMDVNETPETELNAAAQKMPHSTENEDVEEPSRKKMKMDITATLTDGPKAVDSEISNVSADVKLSSTAEMTRAERILNGTATAADEITEEELIQSFVPELIKDD